MIAVSGFLLSNASSQRLPSYWDLSYFGSGVSLHCSTAAAPYLRHGISSLDCWLLHSQRDTTCFSNEFCKLSNGHRNGKCQFSLQSQREALPKIIRVQFSLVAQSCLTFCDPGNCNMPGLPVHHQLPECPRTHVN